MMRARSAEGPCGPALLSAAKDSHRGVDVVRVGQGQVVDPLPREGGEDLCGGSAWSDTDARQQSTDESGIDGHAVTTISTRWNSFTSL